MTDFKRRTLFLTSGKQIKLYGNSMAIGTSLEIGEGSAPNIFSFMEQNREEKPAENSTEGISLKDKSARKAVVTIQNPHRLTDLELMEIADYNIRLWMDLKDNIRKYGGNNPKVFNRDSLR